MNFAFILYQAIGAYITAVLTLPSASTPVDEKYILGWHLPWPLPLVGAAVAGALLALAVGSFALRPRRRDFQATVMLVVSIIAATLWSPEQGWFNGNQGLFGIPQPFAASLSLGVNGYDWFFLAHHGRRRDPGAGASSSCSPVRPGAGGCGRCGRTPRRSSRSA